MTHPAEQLGVRRTSSTALTDDELCVLDFAVTLGHPLVRHLDQGAYSAHMNVPYTHGASTETTLHALLLGMVASGHLAVVEPGTDLAPQRRLWLTERGLEAWECERRPDWTKVLLDSLADSVLSVLSPSQELNCAFLAVAQEAGLHDFVGRFGHRPASFEIVPHKRLDGVESRCRIADGPSWRADWGLYEARRTWWRTLGELGGYQKTGSGR